MSESPMHDDNRPVLVAAKTVIQREFDPSLQGETLSLMADACSAAAAATGNMNILAEVDEYLCPQGFWPYSNPGKLLAQRFLSTHASTCIAMIGVSQQAMINRAINRIASGECEMTVVFGGESKFRVLQSMIQGVAIEETVQVDDEPDFKWQSPDILWSDLEAARGLVMPTEFYALMESSLQHELGHSHVQHEAYLAAMYERFSAIAAANPVAWRQQAFSAAEISTATAKNPYLAYPYTKLHNSQWNVNLASALIYCSVKKARALGLDESQWVYPVATAESNHVVALSERPVLHRHKGTELCADAIWQYTGLSAADIQHADFYSCFPAAVQSHALDCGFDLSNTGDFTVSGGMSFAGGPINNYVLQSHAAVAERLLENPKDKAWVTCISGINGKQGITLYQKTPPALPYRSFDVTAAAQAAMPACNIVANYSGEAKILAATVAFEKGVAKKAFIIAESADKQRVLAISEQPAMLTFCLQQAVFGSSVQITTEGEFSRD